MVYVITSIGEAGRSLALAFGFLASEEVLQAGLTNIGLRDRK